jgi:hypothetical protein
MNSISDAGERSDALRRKTFGLLPVATAMGYPFLLQAFHLVVSAPE